MKIAFVGKGGSGKTTSAALFAQYSSTRVPTLLVDADINVNLPSLLHVAPPKSLSDTDVAFHVRKLLIGKNGLIKDPKDFKKSTPPARGSTIIRLSRDGVSQLKDFIVAINNQLDLATVGTYTGDGVGTSCYHNNLAILENILSHTDDRQAMVVVDMVAGTDAFASTLHAQFDMLVVVVEPTQKSISVYENFLELAIAAGVENRVFALFNKVQDQDDRDFLAESISKEKVLGTLPLSRHIALVDKGREKLGISQLEENSKTVFEEIYDEVARREVSPDERLKKLWDLHKKYVAQEYVTARHGDLSSQIDLEFRY